LPFQEVLLRGDCTVFWVTFHSKKDTLPAWFSLPEKESHGGSTKKPPANSDKRDTFEMKRISDKPPVVLAGDIGGTKTRLGIFHIDQFLRDSGRFGRAPEWLTEKIELL
jgi:hypothetical protein